MFHARFDLAELAEWRVNSSLLYAVAVVRQYAGLPYDVRSTQENLDELLAGRKGRPAPQGKQEQSPAKTKQGRGDQQRQA